MKLKLLFILIVLLALPACSLQKSRDNLNAVIQNEKISKQQRYYKMLLDKKASLQLEKDKLKGLERLLGEFKDAYVYEGKSYSDDELANIYVRDSEKYLKDMFDYELGVRKWFWNFVIDQDAVRQNLTDEREKFDAGVGGNPILANEAYEKSLISNSPYYESLKVEKFYPTPIYKISCIDKIGKPNQKMQDKMDDLGYYTSPPSRSRSYYTPPPSPPSYQPYQPSYSSMDDLGYRTSPSLPSFNFNPIQQPSFSHDYYPSRRQSIEPSHDYYPSRLRSNPLDNRNIQYKGSFYNWDEYQEAQKQDEELRQTEERLRQEIRRNCQPSRSLKQIK